MCVWFVCLSEGKGEQSLSTVVACWVNSHFSMSANGDFTGVQREGKKGGDAEG